MENNQISAEVCENALALSNIDSMTKKGFRTRYYTVCALVFAVFTAGMNVFAYDYIHLDVFNTFALVALSMYVGFYAGCKMR